MILWSNILIPVASMIITVFATLYTVSKRVENENKEKHKPYLTLENIQSKELNEYKYYITIKGKNKGENFITVNIKLQNIGYGVASNIKFYDLLTGENIKGNQSETPDENQRLSTTLDIAINTEKNIQAKLITNLTEEDNIEIQDHSRILCIYQDLNGNIYDFIICINLKTKTTFDFFAYQRTSYSYKKMLNQNKKEYKKILKSYKK